MQPLAVEGGNSSNGSSGVADAKTKAAVSVGNKFELFMGCSSDDGD